MSIELDRDRIGRFVLSEVEAHATSDVADGDVLRRRVTHGQQVGKVDPEQG